MRKFYAMEYMSSDEKCTYGQAGKNGRHNLAVNIRAFSTKKERDDFIDWNHADAITYSQLHTTARAITKKEFYSWFDELNIDGFFDYPNNI